MFFLRRKPPQNQISEDAYRPWKEYGPMDPNVYFSEYAAFGERVASYPPRAQGGRFELLPNNSNGPPPLLSQHAPTGGKNAFVRVYSCVLFFCREV